MFLFLERKDLLYFWILYSNLGLHRNQMLTLHFLCYRKWICVMVHMNIDYIISAFE